MRARRSVSSSLEALVPTVVLVGLAACSAAPAATTTTTEFAARGSEGASMVATPIGTIVAPSDGPIEPGSDLPPGFDPAAIERLAGAMPAPLDWAAVDPDPAVPTPASVMGHEIGERYTRHHQLVDWCRALADASPRVSLEMYGTSNQGRPLMVLVVTSPENHARLDEILAANARLADPAGTSDAEATRIASSNPSISWLSYNVHGNEGSCTEAAILVSYRLAADRRAEVTSMLDDSIVVIDPCLNPDGRERYVSFFQQNVGDAADPFPASAEHREPWPSGRANHYLFDLNRDWVWGTQVESRQRLPIYRRFLPQLHIDVHEQGLQSPYFLGAGDTPYSRNIPEDSRTWTEVFGLTMGAAFDAARFVYATRERFDYLYPGYGKVLPVYHGAVGLLLEQAGHGRAGRAVTVDDQHGRGVMLTLKARAEHHATASLAGARTTAVLRRQQLERFRAYFVDAMTPEDAGPNAWIVRADSDPRAMADLLGLASLHGIEVHRTTMDTTIGAADLEGFHPPFTVDGAVTLPAGSMVVPSGQPMGRLARTLLERAPFIEDPDTYDITAWSTIPLFGLTGWSYAGSLDELATERIELDGTFPLEPSPRTGPTEAQIAASMAVAIEDGGQDYNRVLGEAARRRVFARLLDKDILLRDGHVVPRGSLVAHVSRNDPADLAAVAAVAAASGTRTHLVDSSIPASGPTLGNNANRRFVAPRRIVVASDNPTSSLSFGHTRHMLERRHGAPHSVVRTRDLASLDWARIDVLVLPSSSGYTSVLGESGVEALAEWLRGGGTIVTVGSASTWAGRNFLSLLDVDPTDDAETDALADVSSTRLHELTWSEREQRGVDRRVPGAMFSATVDRSHPLATGVAAHLAFHVFNDRPMRVDAGAHVIARYGALDDAGGPWIGGVAGPRARRQLAGTPAVSHHVVGRGCLIRFHSDPTNRGMNRAGMDLLTRSILLGPSFSPARQPLGAGAAAGEDDGA